MSPVRDCCSRMKSTLITFLILPVVSEMIMGEHCLICPNPTLKAREGDDVVLQCHTHPMVDLSSYTVDVKRTGRKGVVHAYRHRHDHPHDQMDQYRNRTTLIHEDLSRGVVTLRISSVKQSDSGPYKIYVPKPNCSFIINITVGAAKTVWIIVAASVGGVVCIAGIAAAVAVSILVKQGKIQIFRKMLRTGGDAETLPNHIEMGPPMDRTTEVPDSLAENDLPLFLISQFIAN